MEAFLSALAETRDCETALAVLTRFARHWRFDCIAIGELPAPGSSRLKPFFFTNWPKSWFEAYVEEGIGGDDPVVVLDGGLQDRVEGEGLCLRGAGKRACEHEGQGL